MLRRIQLLFDELEKREIRYCNWKSNNELEKSLHGDIDIELLCDRDNVAKMESALAECGYKRFPDVSCTDFPGITNYIGYDEDSGKLVHIHLHYELTLGTPYLKEYVTPWASYVLDNRIKDNETGVWITDPNIEMVLLLVRYALKIRRWNVLSRHSYFNSFLTEYHWLREKTEIEAVTHACSDLFSSRTSSHVQKMVESEPTISQFHKLRTIVQPQLHPYSTRRKNTSSALAFFRKGIRGFGKLNESILHQPIATRRTLSPTGIEIAFIGIDGSGKSTYVQEISEWISWKADIYPVYFGSGDGRSSLLRYPLKKLNQLRSRLNHKRRSNERERCTKADSQFNTPQTDLQDDEKSGRIGIAKTLWALTLAREKKKKRRQSKRARNKGLIVIMDRYPQAQVPGHNDGPLLQRWNKSESRILQWLSKWEKSVYEQLHETPPDIIIKLQTSPNTAKQRKPETPLQELKKKANTIEQIEYSDQECTTVVVDTERDMDTVIRDIKNIIWENL